MPAPKKPTLNQNRHTLQMYLRHMRTFRWQYIVTALGVAGFVAFDLVGPLLLKQLFDNLSHQPRPEVGILIAILVSFAGVRLLSSLFYRIAHFTQNFAVSRTMSDLLDTCFAALHSHSYTFFSNALVGGLARKATRYAESFEDIYDQAMWNLWPSTLTLFSIVAILSRQHLWLGLGILVWAIIYVALNYWFVSYKVKFDRIRADVDTTVSAHLADTLTNHLNLKLFGGNSQEVASFGGLTTSLFKAQRKSWDLDAISQTLQSTLIWVLEIGSFYLAIRLWSQGNFTVGDFVLLQAYLLQIDFNLWNIGRNLHRIYEKFANAAEMTEILRQERDVVDMLEAETLARGAGSVEFKDVRFGYDAKKPVFTDFNLAIKPGERIALVGTSGSGKTTLTKLLFRFLNIQGGQILIDGQDISKVTQESLREQLALVPQEPSLFHRSILENIRYAKPEASLEEVRAAAKAAHAHEFISKLPKGYDTLVGERGVKLSGGERQRVAIARAILKDAPILILDEATSSLDSESEQLIQDALQTLMRGRTTIVIAHRLSTIMQMDTIYVLKKGEVVESGSHKELVNKEDGAYRRLWDIQVGGFVS